MNKYLLLIAFILLAVTGAQAGELQKDYFAATKPGAWATYQLDTSDGTKARSSSQREADQGGQVVVEEVMKIQAGPGAGTESRNIHVLQKDFNLARDWLSFGKFTEKMRMKGRGYDMPVDPATLATIKKGSKDFRGAVTFEAAEVVDGRACDRYAYTVAIMGPGPSQETGKIWLDPTVVFGIVRQSAKALNADGSVASSFELRLKETGQVQMATTVAAPASRPAAPVAPAVVSLLEGYQAGRLGLVVSVPPGSQGRQLQLTLINKTEAPLTVKLPAGALDIPASSPVEMLKIAVKKNAQLVVPAGDTSEAVTVEQRPGRGAIEGRFELSVYEGTQLFSGSITKGTVAGK
ncbi:MAG: hypothetical protein HY910_13670 [Desulfarculus sp.]|nr:hypothetical protein [Desulfarculus sp.]